MNFSRTRRSSRRLLLIGVCLIVIMLLLMGYHHVIVSILSPDPIDSDQTMSGAGPAEMRNNPRPRSQLFPADLLILVMSAPGSVTQRTALRDTWFGILPPKVTAKFVIGTEGMADETLATLLEENSIHSDFVLIENLHDSYENLTLKLLLMFKWAHENFDFDFLLKADDDSFVRVRKILEGLRDRSRTGRLYWGFFDGRATVKRRGKWRELRWALCDHYLPYAVGGGYVVSADLVGFVATNSEFLQLYRNEDVSMGTWLAPLDINRVHDPKFDTEYKSRGCNNDYIVTHKQSVDMIYEKHARLSKNLQLCDEEYQTRFSYIYNWTVPPSHCCNRVQGVP